MQYVESSLGWLLSSQKGRDAGLIKHTSPFRELPATLNVSLAEIGPSGSNIGTKWSAFGEGTFPTTEWTIPKEFDGEIKEWVLMVEDADAPLPSPVVHGWYYGIPSDKTNVSACDLELDPLSLRTSGGRDSYKLKGGFLYGANIRKTIYGPPRGFKNHGPHRYFYTVLGLAEPLDHNQLSDGATKSELVSQLEGKLVIWGEWIGIWEYK